MNENNNLSNDLNKNNINITAEHEDNPTFSTTAKNSEYKSKTQNPTYATSSKPIIIERTGKTSSQARRDRKNKAIIITISIILVAISLLFAIPTLIENINLSKKVDFFDRSCAFVIDIDPTYYHTYDCDEWTSETFYVFNTNYAEEILGYKPCPHCHNNNNNDDNYYDEIILEDW